MQQHTTTGCNNTLQHQTATHLTRDPTSCCTQHTATTHYNELQQHAATTNCHTFDARSNILLHTTHCNNTLQRTATTHCNNTLQRTATARCNNTLQQQTATHVMRDPISHCMQHTATTHCNNTLQQHTATTHCIELQQCAATTNCHTFDARSNIFMH